MDNNRKLIGYQVESANGLHEMPAELFSFEVVNKSSAQGILDDQENPDYWNIVPIYDGDIENPTISFDANPDD